MNQDNEGRLWIATYQWLARYQGGKFVIYGRKQGLPDDSISAIGSDHSGTIWIGTRRSGLYRLRDGVIAPYGAQMSLGVGSTQSTKTATTISGLFPLMG